MRNLIFTITYLVLGLLFAGISLYIVTVYEFAKVRNAGIGSIAMASISVSCFIASALIIRVDQKKQ